MAKPFRRRRVIAGDAFQRVVRRGDWLWLRRKLLYVYPGESAAVGPLPAAEKAEPRPGDVQT
jgi:hypothetical protein